MSRIVVILPTGTYRAKDFIDAGAELGVDLIVASEGRPPIDMGDGYLQIDCTDPDSAAAAIVAAGDDVPLDGIVAADDNGVVVAAIAGTKLGLAANDPESARATRDKALLRERLGGAEVPQPAWARIDEEDTPGKAAEAIGYPLVVKPISLAAGQGVIKVDTPGELDHAVERARDIARSAGTDGRTLVVERYIPGSEVAVEGLVGDNGLTPLAIFDKPDVPAGPGFEETILVTPSRHPASTQDEILRVAALAVAALGLSRGPVHIELMVTPERVFVIEVAARSIGGLCSRTLDFGLMDTSLESLILRNAIGRDKPELRRSGAASGVLMIPIPSAGVLVSIDGLDETPTIPGVTGIEITARTGDDVSPPPEGGRYLGFVFARGRTPGFVEAALRKAMETIVVRIG